MTTLEIGKTFHNEGMTPGGVGRGHVHHLFAAVADFHYRPVHNMTQH